jgi:fatty-acyl-CoA synthase
MLDPAGLAARRFGDAVALISDDRSLSFNELDRRAGALTRILEDHGLTPGDRVAVMLGNRVGWFDATLACLRGGFVRSYLNDRLSLAEVVAILEDLEPAALVSAAAFAATVESIPARLGPVRITSETDDYDALLNGTEPVVARDVLADDAIELIRYTSGTTGRPKGVLQTAQARAAWTLVATLEMEMRPGDVVLHAASLNFAASGIPFPALWAGARQVIQPSFDPEGALDLIAHFGVTHSVMVPTMISRLAEATRDFAADVSSLRVLMYGAAPFAKAQLQTAIAALGNVFIGSYGMSEFNAVTFLGRDQHDPDGLRLTSCGRPHMLADVRIVSDDGTQLRPGETGNIEIRGLQAATGYWRRAEETAQLHRGGGWIATNDLGYRDDDGYLFIVDRKSDIINSGGFNIYPREVEEALAAHPRVREGVVIGVPDPSWGEAVCAVTEQELDEWCRGRIAGYKVPRRYVFLAEELPKNAGGKFIRRALRDRVRLGAGNEE